MDLMRGLRRDCIRGTAAAAAAEPSPPDLISLLPDCILGTIVSLLPHKAGARTAVLSRRWRHIWQSVPLDLSLDCDGSDLYAVTGRTISLLLSSRRGPIRSVGAMILGGPWASKDHDAWVQALARADIHDALTVLFPTDRVFLTVPFFQLAKHSLRCLELHGCRLDVAAAPGHAHAHETTATKTALPRLHFLNLTNVDVSEAALHRILDGCTALRDLTLFRIHGLRRLVLRSRTLSTLSIGPHIPMDELSFADALNLESIVFLHLDLWHIRDITQPAAAPPKLREVTLSMPLLHNLRTTERWALPIVTKLILHMQFDYGEELTKAAHMLNLFPCLNFLQIWCLKLSSYYKYYDEEADECWQLLDEGKTITCLDRRLEKVQMDGYSGAKGEVEFARFLMAKAKVLATMKMLHRFNWSKEEIDSQKNRICISGKASSAAQIYFAETNSGLLKREVHDYIKRVPLI